MDDIYSLSSVDDTSLRRTRREREDKREGLELDVLSHSLPSTMHTDPRQRPTMGETSAESNKTKPTTPSANKSWMKTLFASSRTSSVQHPEIDLSYITSRFLGKKHFSSFIFDLSVLCTPREQPSDAVRTFLEGKHPQCYSILSLDAPPSARVRSFHLLLLLR